MDNPLTDDALKGIAKAARQRGDREVVTLATEVLKLRKALKPLAHHSLPGWDARSMRRYKIQVTEGQVARAWFALHDQKVPK